MQLFGLPVVNFVDQPGNQTGLEAELGGTLLGATRVGEALNEPFAWVSILIRRCFDRLARRAIRRALNLRYAWPSALGLDPDRGRGDGRAQGRDRRRAGPAAKRAELEAFYLNMTSPFRTAEVQHPGHHRPARGPAPSCATGSGTPGPMLHRPHDGLRVIRCPATGFKAYPGSQLAQPLQTRLLLCGQVRSTPSPAAARQHVQVRMRHRLPGPPRGWPAK